jgi:hypothetical protein
MSRNLDPSKSATYCGCDEAEDYLCERHRMILVVSQPEAAVGVAPISSAPSVGIGGAPTRASTFPEDAPGRKRRPVASGVMDYFPDALVAIAEVSWAGNEQHNPGQELHWARGKSTDEADALIRHFLQRGQLDSDGLRHSAKMVWRALALLQKEIEASKYPK